jgi:uncharacterized protein YodC (DUF2158 family)
MSKYCVIGSTGYVGNVRRNWFDGEGDAVAHANMLARKSFDETNRPVTVFVVEVKKVIECGVPAMTVRDLTPQDTATPPPEERTPADYGDEEEEAPQKRAPKAGRRV